MPGDASCSPCLMPATQTPPLKPRRSSHSTGPPKDSGPTPLLRGYCSSRVAPQGQTPTVRPEAQYTLGWSWWVGGPLELLQDSCAKIQGLNIHLPKRQGLLCHSSYPSLISMKGCVKASKKGIFCIYFNKPKAISQRPVEVSGHVS